MSREHRVLMDLERHGIVELKKYKYRHRKNTYVASLLRKQDKFWVDFHEGKTRYAAMDRLLYRVRERLWKECKETEDDAYR